MDTNTIIELNRIFNKKRIYKDSIFVDFVLNMLNKNIEQVAYVESEDGEGEYYPQMLEDSRNISIAGKEFDSVRSINFEGKGEYIVMTMIVESKKYESSGIVEVLLNDSDTEELQLLIEENEDL